MSSTRLLVLGAVRILQPVHGYDVRRELLSWRAERWANVAPGSVYSALKTLERDLLIEVVGTGQAGSGRPAPPTASRRRATRSSPPCCARRGGT